MLLTLGGSVLLPEENDAWRTVRYLGSVSLPLKPSTQFWFFWPPGNALLAPNFFKVTGFGLRDKGIT